MHGDESGHSNIIDYRHFRKRLIHYIEITYIHIKGERFSSSLNIY